MYSITQILHSFLIVLPLVFAMQLLTKKNEESPAIKILGVMMLFVSAYYIVTAKFIAPENEIKEFVSQNVLFFLFLSINPFFYLYTASLTKENYKWNKKEFLHFIPAAILLFWCVIAYGFFDPHSAETAFVFQRVFLKITSIVVYNIQILGYSFGMYMMLRKHKRIICQYFSYDSDKINLNWLKFFLVIYISFSFVDLIVFYFNLYTDWAIYYYIITNAFFIFISNRGLNQPDIYFEARGLSQELIEDIEEEGLDKKQLVQNDKSEQLFEDIINLIWTNKFFEKHELSIYDISKELNVNKTYISFVINNKANKNFNNFVNQYRIDQSKNLLKDQEFDNFTIEAIANLVGFHSKSSFNIAFKKQVGLTPSQYKKESV